MGNRNIEWWEKIARAYEKVIIRTSFYQDMESELVEKLKGRKRVLDLGCGIGNVLEKFLRENPSSTAVGVELNQSMIDIAEREIISEQNNGRVKLVNGDATKYIDSERFDAVVSSNVLFCLEKPFDLLLNAYNTLLPGGHFVLTSMKEGANLETLMQAATEEIKSSGEFKEKEQYLNTVHSVNSMFKGKANVLTNQRIAEVLTKFYGFRRILHNSDTYLGQNFLVAAERGKDVKLDELDVKVAEGDEIIDTFKIRYHCMKERLGFLEANPLLDNWQMEYDVFDFKAHHVIAVHDGRILSLERYVGDSNIGLPVEKVYDLSPIRKQDTKLCEPGRWVSLPFAPKGAGKAVIKWAYNFLLGAGFTHWVGTVDEEPRVISYYKRMGFPLENPRSLEALGIKRNVYFTCFDLNQGSDFFKKD
ncbi:MAG: class I SAM-dependent methyltransferase [Nanoarchaeota archaeon]|nr:class I SAM-dependent methyltransferase [Nanoarchaeota archaeon]